VSATAVLGVDELIELYELLGDEPYGEDVSQRAHALQCAAHARAANARDELVAAALLHDVGHFLVEPRHEGWRDDVDDDHHEEVGARALARLFGPAVAAPVALHVCAKRWRCAVDPDYLGALSATSRATLVAQGGPMGAAGRARFEAHPGFANAVALREWDDLAKDPDRLTGAVRDFESLLRSLVRARP
jgi:gamma-butyrobetaine dioxygenase